MGDSAADVITQALLHHHPARSSRVSVLGIDLPDTCQCGARDLRMGDRWEAHLSDVVVAALTQAGHLGTHPTVTRTNYTAEATWRAAALNVVTTYTHEPIPHATLGQAQRDTLTWAWPTLATALDRLVRAKADFLKEHE